MLVPVGTELPHIELPLRHSVVQLLALCFKKEYHTHWAIGNTVWVSWQLTHRGSMACSRDGRSVQRWSKQCVVSVVYINQASTGRADGPVAATNLIATLYTRMPSRDILRKRRGL